MENDRVKNSARNIVFGLIKYLVSLIFPFIMRTILIYKLGTEYAGITSLFTSILQVLSLSELGFGTAVVYNLYEPVARRDVDRICALLSFFRDVYRVCGTVILVAGLAVCPFIKHLISGTYPSDINIYIIFILLLVNTSISYLFCGYKSVLFTASQRDDMASRAQIISNLVMYLLQITVLAVLKNYYAYIFSMIIGTLLNNIMLQAFSIRMFPEISCKGEISKEEKKSLFSSVGKLFGHQLDMVVITSADNIVISSFMGLTVLTIYNNYYFILNAVLSVLIMVANSFAGSIGNSIAVETKEKNYKNFIDFTYSIEMISAACTILMLVLYQDFIRIWMGDGMLLDIRIVLLLCISFYARQFRRPVLTYKTAAGYWSLDAVKPYISAVANLVLNIISVQVIGLYGVILSTIFSLVVIETPWETYVIFKQYFKSGLGGYLKTQGNILIKMIIIGLFSYFLLGIIRVGNIGMFILKGCIAALLVGGLFVALSFRDEGLKDLLNTIKRIRKK